MKARKSGLSGEANLSISKIPNNGDTQRKPLS